MKTGIHIGASPQAIQAYSKAIKDIMARPYCDEKTKQIALRSLQQGVGVKNTTIANCVVTGT